MNAEKARVKELPANQSDSADEALASAINQLRRSGGVPADAVAIMAHEMRNPLNAMLGFTEMMRRETYGPHSDPRYTEYSEIVHTAAQKLLRICNRLLEGENVHEIPAANETGTVSARKVMADTVELFSAMARERGVGLEMVVDDGFPRLHIDGEVLEGVLANLVSNAIKFTPTGGHVTVKASVSSKDGAAIMVISDTGVGMASETLLQLMKSLPVPPGVGLHGDVGTGLGLGLVRKRLASLGIQLEFRSEENAGTAVVLTFPRAAAAPEES